MRILFLDVTAPKPYDAQTLIDSPQGGTESTVTRIAEGLAAREHDVIVAQKVRDSGSSFNAEYTSYDEPFSLTERPDAVVALRTPGLIPEIRKRWPDAKPFLWMHDFNLPEIVQRYESCLKDSGTHIFCVSRTHKTAVVNALLTQLEEVSGVTVSRVYNPIEDELQPDSTPVDPYKLVFFSSPHKGLDYAVSLFKRLREFDNRFRLHIANPGYLPNSEYSDSGIVQLGKLTHADVIKEVRSALAVFHPNWVFPETFGLVHAEALAVGTPVLTTGLGANREIINNPEFICMDRQAKPWIDRILKWRENRPKTAVNDEFRLSKVLDQWERELK